jgi:hypothetical protein
MRADYENCTDKIFAKDEAIQGLYFAINYAPISNEAKHQLLLQIQDLQSQIRILQYTARRIDAKLPLPKKLTPYLCKTPSTPSDKLLPTSENSETLSNAT